MKGNVNRTARVEMRMTEEEKAMVERAAEVGDEDTSSYMRRIVLTESKALLARMKPSTD